ncbi:MAG: TRAP transporter fused permease subunit [Thermoproteota archaeon]
MESEGTRSQGGSRALRYVYLAAALAFFLYLIYYYYTGVGGPLRLAVLMVPYAFVLHVLDSLRHKQLYPRLGKLNYPIAAVYIALAAASAAYILANFNDLIGVRMGSYNTYDVVFGTIAFLLALEYSRRRHFALFLVNLFLFAYALYGFLPGPFSHPGLPLRRVLTAMSVEFETGVFERLPQLALTIIGAFVVFVSIAQGFGVVDSIVKTVVSRASRSARAIPQAAVVSSMAVASVSGSGAANAATTGSVTIPLMKRVGVPPKVAAAIETASSIGGQLMPPIMGISAFVMADFLGVSYFDVVARGYMPAIVYYLGVAVAVYLMAYRFLPRRFSVSDLERMGIRAPQGEDYFNISVFLVGIALLIALMGYYYIAPTYAALTTSWIALILASAGTIYFTLKSGGSLREAFRKLGSSLVETVERFAAFTSDLTLLLATLGIMTGLLAITGVPTKIGFMLMSLGRESFYLLAAIGFLFGYIVGLGLPPVVTYILTVIVIAPYFIEAGINPWVVHFYAFFIGVFSELSPPTSVTAAVAAKIADAPFTRTMIEAMKFAMPLFVLIPGVLMHPELVAEPSLAQVKAGVLLLGATIAIAAALGPSIHRVTAVSAAVRAALFLLGLAALVSRGPAFELLGALSMLAGVAAVVYASRAGPSVEAERELPA